MEPFVVPVWDDALLTGVERIDEQHRWLFALATRVVEGMTACQGIAERSGVVQACESEESSALADAVYGLCDYVVEHFKDEEALMKETGYPALWEHKVDHDSLLGKVMIFMNRFTDVHRRPEAIQLSGEICEFIVTWLTCHIGEKDMAFAAWKRDQATA